MKYIKVLAVAIVALFAVEGAKAQVVVHARVGAPIVRTRTVVVDRPYHQRTVVVNRPHHRRHHRRVVVNRPVHHRYHHNRVIVRH